MARCPRCGAKTDPTLAAYCAECGQTLLDEAPPPPSAPSSPPPSWAPAPAARPTPVAPSRVRTIGGGILRSAMARFAIVAVLAGGYGLYDSFVSADRDDTGAITDAGDVSAEEMAVGDCIDWPDPDEELIDKVAGVPCDQPHDAEIYAMPWLSVGANEYPGIEELFEPAAQACYEAFEDYVGVPYDLDVDHYFDFFSPSEEGWADGDREIVCLAYRIDEAKMTASVRASA